MSPFARCRMLLAALTRRRVPVTRASLAVERLEDRWVPDAFRWRPLIGTNGLWSWNGG